MNTILFLAIIYIIILCPRRKKRVVADPRPKGYWNGYELERSEKWYQQDAEAMFRGQ